MMDGSLLALLILSAGTIALLVFLNSTQPFVLTEIYGVIGSTGSISGTLALVDEITCIVIAPFWGVLSDYLGMRSISSIGLILMAVGVYNYPRMPTVYPALLLCRVIFACGAAACVSMMTAIISVVELHPETISEEADHKGKGTISGLVGFASGLGAVAAVSFLLPLPTRLGLEEDAVTALKKAFMFVASGTVFLAIFLAYTLPESVTVLIDTESGLETEAAEPSKWRAYFGKTISHLKTGFSAAKNDRNLQLAFFGSLVSRSSAVVMSLFVPLVVNDWFYRSGRCSHSDASEGCREGIIAAAIITGIANTLGLVSAYILGICCDRFSSRKVLVWSSSLGVLASILLAATDRMVGFKVIAFCSLLAVAQMGIMTSSLALCSSKKRANPGSIAGVYSLSGSIGILLVTQLGGQTTKYWIRTPFVVVSCLFACLVTYTEWISRSHGALSI